MSEKRYDIARMTRLAGLVFAEEEQAKISVQLQEIVGYFDLLSEAETEDIEPMYEIFDCENKTREDVPVVSDVVEKVLTSAPETEGHYFRIQQMFREIRPGSSLSHVS